MAEQPDSTVEFILREVFKQHSELIFDEHNKTEIVKWCRSKQPLVTSVIVNRAIEALYPELHKHQAPELPRGVMLSQQSENLRHNQELFNALDSRYPLIKNTPENTQLILDKLTLLAGPMESVKYSPELIAAAIHQLGSKLSTNPKPAPPAPPKPPREQLQPGQLPLRATEQQMRAATRDQLRDLVARRRAAGLE